MPVRAGCAAAAPCAGTLTLTVKRARPGHKGKHKGKHRLVTVTLARHAYHVGAGRAATIRLVLDATGRRLLAGARGHRQAVTLHATLKGGRGRSRRVTLREAAKRHRRK